MKSAYFLLVEDTPSDIDLALVVHKNNGAELEVRVCRDGQEAIDALLPGGGRLSGNLPRFIVTDMKMHRVEGLRLIETVRADESTRHIPIIVFSSSAEPRDIERAYALGANAYCIKPMGFNNFSRALSSLLKFWGEFVETR